MLTPSRTDQIVETALQAVRSASDWKAVLDELPVPTYITDADGAVTYWNRACVHFAGLQDVSPGLATIVKLYQINREFDFQAQTLRGLAKRS